MWNDDRLVNEMNVSRESILRLKKYAELLTQWQSVKNLVSSRSESDLWTRHFADSAQLNQLRPNARHWVDLGSGAGFPGLVIAVLKAGQPGVRIDLIEADHRKCAFLRHVSRETKASATVHHGRIESVLPTLPTPDIITARALSSLDQLLDWSLPALKKGATGLYLKGQDIANELTRLSKPSNFHIDIVPSRTDVTGRIAIVTSKPPAGKV